MSKKPAPPENAENAHNTRTVLPLHDLPMAAAVLESIPDASGNPELYIRETNQHLPRALKLTAKHLLDRPLSALLLDNHYVDEQEFRAIAAAAAAGTSQKLERLQPFMLSVPERGLHVQVQAAPLPAEGYCIVYLQDISPPVLAAHIGERLLQSDSLEDEYQQLCRDVLYISGAKVAALNVFAPDGKSFRTVALAGPKASTQEVIAHMGFHPVGRTWKYDPLREERIGKQAVTRFTSLAQLSENGLPGHVTKAVQRILGLGETAIVRLQHSGLILGDFTLLMPGGRQLANESLLRLIAHQTAMVLLKQRSQRELDRFRRIFDEASYGSAITDLEGRIIYVNRFFAEIHGWSIDDLIGTPINSLYAEGETELVISSGKTRAIEIWQQHRDGHTFPMMINGMVFSGGDGLPEFIALTAIDLTEQHNAQESMRQAMQQATEASRAKSDFLASMSHEIRTPLNGIIGFADLLTRTRLNPTQQQYADTMNQAALSLLQLINDILDFSKIEAGQLSLNPEPTELHRFLQTAVSMMEYLATKAGNELIFEADDDLPVWVHVDAVRLQQVIINLLSNAIKFTENGRILFRIRIEHPTDDSDNTLPPQHTRVMFSVEDNGIGISPDQQNDIFKSFHQADPSTTRKYGGTGLGLPISNRLLNMMNSCLQLESTPNEGSCFFFAVDLPHAEKPALSEPAQDQHDEDIPCAMEEMGCSNISVLIADDDRTNRLLATLLLRRMLPDAEMYEAADGREALTQFDTYHPDLILLDLQMPELDGYDVAGEIRTRERERALPTTVIIAVTAAAVAGEQARCQEAGMNDYTTKPIDEKHLKKLIFTYIAGDSA